VGDIINLKIKADNGENFNVPVGPFLPTVEVDAKIVLKAWITTFGAGYNFVDNEKWSLDVMGGRATCGSTRPLRWTRRRSG
jgi:hypothetical protein